MSTFQVSRFIESPGTCRYLSAGFIVNNFSNSSKNTNSLVTLGLSFSTHSECLNKNIHAGRMDISMINSFVSIRQHPHNMAISLSLTTTFMH